MWERTGYNTDELIYFSQFGTSEARWVIKGSVYGEWAETSADPSDAKPPLSASWLINDNEGNFYQTLTVSCSQCEETPSPTPDPTETPTQHPTTLLPTSAPTPSPSEYCAVLNVTDLTNGFYTGYFELDVLRYNDRHMWTDKTTGEKIFWADSAIFYNESTVEDIWMIGFKAEEGEQDSHFLIRSEFSEDQYPPINMVTSWKEYTYNEFSNQVSEIAIECEKTVLPTTSPTLSPSDPLCTELHVETCCDPIYSSLDGIYKAETHRGGKNMYSNSVNNYHIYYTEDNSGNFWSIRSEDDSQYWVMSSEDNGPYPSWYSIWKIQYEFASDLGVDITINCSESFSPSQSPTAIPSPVPTPKDETLHPSKMPTKVPTNPPSGIPTQEPSESCVALFIEDEDGIYNGTYAQLPNSKNGKPQWMNYETGTDLYWVDRGHWTDNWVLRRSLDGSYAMIYDMSDSLHPPLNDYWSSLGNGLLQGDKYQNLIITCTTQPPAPSPTSSPTNSPTCEGNAIRIEDPCAAETDGKYAGDYNFERFFDEKRVFVRVDGEYEVLYNSDNLYADHWMIRSHDSHVCDEYLTVHGYGTFEIPPTDSFWQAYGCACTDVKRKYECNLRITCLETMAPIPTSLPTPLPTPSPIDTAPPTEAPTYEPSNNPTERPTLLPTLAPSETPTEEPSSSPPTLSPVPYDCTNIDMQPCYNTTNQIVTFYERTENENQMQVNSNYYETKLYTEQKGYTFTAEKDMIMYEAGMAFVNMASYQSITVRVFDSSESLLFESDYSISGKGETHTSGTPRGDYYTFRNMDVQLDEGQEYTIVFVIHCPATKTSRAEYPLCAPHYELFAIDDFVTGVNNVYAYGEDYILPDDSDLYAPFIRICYGEVTA